MVGQHEYAVINAHEDDNGIKWLRIRNPWGETGREYIRSGNILKARATKEGEFDLELNDLTKRFETMTVSGVLIREELNQFL